MLPAKAIRNKAFSKKHVIVRKYLFQEPDFLEKPFDRFALVIIYEFCLSLIVIIRVICVVSKSTQMKKCLA